METKLKRASLNELPRASGGTFEEYELTLVALDRHLSRIKQMTQKYPVFLHFAGYGYRFENPDEVDQFLALLRAEVARYRSMSHAV